MPLELHLGDGAAKAVRSHSRETLATRWGAVNYCDVHWYQRANRKLDSRDLKFSTLIEKRSVGRSRTLPQSIALFIIAIPLALPGCGPKEFPAVEPRPNHNAAPDAVVYLVGDAGDATPETPLIQQLRRDVRRHAAETDVVVAFLGDNVYDRGLHGPEHPERGQDVVNLEAQIGVVRGLDALGVLLPGNHDWGYKGERGLAQIQRQGDYVSRAANDSTRVAFLPPAGCPGPAVREVGGTVLLILLETDLWLRDETPLPECPQRSTDEALAELRRILSERPGGREVVVLGHHPLKSFGPHGGYFGLKDQLFPATHLWEPLYIPLPFIYPAIRNLGIRRQDLGHGTNRRMREQLADVFRAFPEAPLVYAAGHEHSLQVLPGWDYGVEYVLVSGAGSRLTAVGQREALFAVGGQHRENGYMRLAFFENGRALLTVITDGTASCRAACAQGGAVRYWSWLDRRDQVSSAGSAPPR